MTTATELLSRFADAADTSSRRAALIDLVKTKQIHKVASEESFRRGLERLARSAREIAGEIDRLLAVATLQRAAAAAPPVRSRVSEDGVPRVVLKAAVEVVKPSTLRTSMRSPSSKSIQRPHELPDDEGVVLLPFPEREVAPPG